ncbi:MAG: type II toxin-antitoxin system HicA family toxin [Oscillospiraceae bacterium]|jgi:predicted RNA binding protein YcfA (HicA-like mRNA interferase family)|nr:type II toxin-antitoxin system HicA family toxin [Oscillospiraceae bacterium]
MNKRKLFQSIVNNQKNVKYDDFVVVMQAFGFVLKRTVGSHNVFKNPDIGEIMNVQNVNGEAKPYQIKQLLALIERYNVKMED